MFLRFFYCCSFSSVRKKSDAVERLRDRIGDQRFDIVIDFSAYNSDVITDALEVLQDRIKIYVYISTDSVYEVGGVTQTNNNGILMRCCFFPSFTGVSNVRS